MNRIDTPPTRTTFTIREATLDDARAVVGEQEFIVGSDRQTDRVMARALPSGPR